MELGLENWQSLFLGLKNTKVKAVKYCTFELLTKLKCNIMFEYTKVSVFKDFYSTNMQLGNWKLEKQWKLLDFRHSFANTKIWRKKTFLFQFTDRRFSFCKAIGGFEDAWFFNFPENGNFTKRDGRWERIPSGIFIESWKFIPFNSSRPLSLSKGAKSKTKEPTSPRRNFLVKFRKLAPL